jgi:uncharacterized membrane protein YfcA
MKLPHITPVAQKILIGILTMGVWLGLVIAKMTPTEGFVGILALIMQGLGIYHIAKKDAPPTPPTEPKEPPQ